MTASAKPRTRSLVEEINKEHRLISGQKAGMLTHAIRCGELLIEAQREVGKGSWVEWLRDNVEVHPTTAFGYMRLARHKEEVLEGVKNAGLAGIDPALEFLSNKRRLTPEAKEEMIRLYNNGNGKPLEEIGRIFHVKKSTVWYYVSAKSRDRRKRLNRHRRDRERKALAREQARRTVQGLGGRIARVYSLIRQAENELDRYLNGELESQERLRLMETLDALYTAEDRIVESLRASTKH